MKQYLYTIRVTDTSRFAGYREEQIYGRSHALDDRTLTISYGLSGRLIYNWSLIQKFQYECVEASNDIQAR